MTTHTRTPVERGQRGARFGTVAGLLMSVLLGALLIALAYQIPSTHALDIGGYDAAYVQGFYDPSRSTTSGPPAYLEGSDGSARWTQASSFLIFPQIGLPAELTLHLRSAPETAAQKLTVVLNGTTELGQVTATPTWNEYRFSLNGGLLKPSDVVIELRSATAPLSHGDERQVGVLLDRAALRTAAWPIMPYPAQLALGMLASGLLYAVFGWRTGNGMLRWVLWSSVGVALAFLLLYRLQPLYPYPLRRLLPALDVGLAALLALRFGPALARRMPVLLDVVALGGSAVWLGAVLITAREHVTLSIPGVEKDFRVFAQRSAQLFGVFQADGTYTSATDGVLRADGFYNLGYPLLLWLLRPFTNDNPFLAARVVAAGSGFVLLIATWWLAWRLLGRAGGVLALCCVAFSPLVGEYALYLGSDMPFAALCTVSLALLLGAGAGGRRWAAAAGVAAGAAFLMRHPGIVLLPFGVIWLLYRAGVRFWPATWRLPRTAYMPVAAFVLAFAVAIMPQLVVNVRDTGNPLFSWQAKNIWLATYANSDWGRQGEERDDISLREVVLRDPARFLNNWTTNLRGFVGAGGEDVSEFGRADQLRLLAFPANWLAIAGMLGWITIGTLQFLDERRKTKDERRNVLPSSFVFHPSQHVALLGWVVLYIVGVSVGLSLLRFALPLAPVYAIAAAWSLLSIAEIVSSFNQSTEHQEFSFRRARWLLGLSFVLCGMLVGGFAIGGRYVLGNQSPDEVAAVQLVQRMLKPGERVRMELDPRAQFDTYSAVAHRVVPRDEAAQYVLRPASAPAQNGETLIERAGGYALYHVNR